MVTNMKPKKIKHYWIPLKDGWRLGVSLFYDGKVHLGLNHRSWNDTRMFIHSVYLNIREANLLMDRITKLLKVWKTRGEKEDEHIKCKQLHKYK